MLLLIICFIAALLVIPASHRDGMKRGRLDERRRSVYELPSTVHGCGGTWDKWKPISIGVVDDKGKQLYKELYQRRICDGCGYMQEEKVGR